MYPHVICVSVYPHESWGSLDNICNVKHLCNLTYLKQFIANDQHEQTGNIFLDATLPFTTFSNIPQLTKLTLINNNTRPVYTNYRLLTVFIIFTGVSVLFVFQPWPALTDLMELKPLHTFKLQMTFICLMALNFFLALLIELSFATLSVTQFFESIKCAERKQPQYKEMTALWGNLTNEITIKNFYSWLLTKTQGNSLYRARLYKFRVDYFFTRFGLCLKPIIVGDRSGLWFSDLIRLFYVSIKDFVSW